MEGLLGFYRTSFPFLLSRIAREAPYTLTYSLYLSQEGLYWMKSGEEKKGEELEVFYKAIIPFLLPRIVREAQCMFIYNPYHSQEWLYWMGCENLVVERMFQGGYAKIELRPEHNYQSKWLLNLRIIKS